MGAPFEGSYRIGGRVACFDIDKSGQVAMIFQIK